MLLVTSLPLRFAVFSCSTLLLLVFFLYQKMRTEGKGLGLDYDA